LHSVSHTVTPLIVWRTEFQRVGHTTAWESHACAHAWKLSVPDLCAVESGGELP